MTAEVAAAHELGATAFEHHAGVGQGVGLATSDGHAAADTEVLGLEAVTETRAEKGPHELRLHDPLVTSGMKEHELGELPSQLDRVAPIFREIETQTDRSANRCRRTRGRVEAGVVPSACRHRDGKQRIRCEPPVLAEHDAAHHPDPDERADDEQLLEREAGGVHRLARLCLDLLELLDGNLEQLDPRLVILDLSEDVGLQLGERSVLARIADQLLESIEGQLQAVELRGVVGLDIFDACPEAVQLGVERIRRNAVHRDPRLDAHGSVQRVGTTTGVAVIHRARVARPVALLLHGLGRLGLGELDHDPDRLLGAVLSGLLRVIACNLGAPSALRDDLTADLVIEALGLVLGSAGRQLVAPLLRNRCRGALCRRGAGPGNGGHHDRQEQRENSIRHRRLRTVTLTAVNFFCRNACLSRLFRPWSRPVRGLGRGGIRPNLCSERLQGRINSRLRNRYKYHI